MSSRRAFSPRSLDGRLPRRERGVFAIIVALTLVVLIGFIGLALDGGHLYVTKTELQNAADACALSAAYELTDSPAITSDAFARSDAAGRYVAQRNSVEFQKQAVAAGDITVGFSTTLGGTYVPASANPPGNAVNVRCVIQRTGITPWFMEVLGFGDQSVVSLATATLQSSQTTCAIPMALCSTAPAPSFGYAVGQWYGLDFSDSGGTANYTGNVRWIDFNPGQQTPGCSGNGAQELACLLAGPGQCTLPAPTGATCGSGSATAAPGCVGETGQISSLQAAYNSRFGLYKSGSGQLSPDTAVPDFTGYAFSPETWPLGHDAYSGSSSGPNYLSARDQHLPTSNVAGVSPPFYSAPYQPSTTAVHAAGASRRVVVLPIVDCSSFTSGQQAPIQGYACALLLDPYRKVGSNVVSRLEYLGRADLAGSPCSSAGVPGGTGSQGPRVPTLTQ